MRIASYAVILFTSLLAGLLAAPAQQPESPGPSPSGSIKLTVAVDTKTGQPAVNLSQQDFTVLDNKTPRPITSFKVMSPAEEPVKVILFIDAVNAPFTTVAYMRGGIGKFLKANEGRLANPTAVSVLTDQGAQISTGFSTNGLALNDSIEHQNIGLREIKRGSEWGGDERLQISLNAFHQLLAFSSTVPGRKIILWISPGWPLLSGPQFDLTSKQQRQIFDTIVSFSTQLRQNNVTLYNINPIGAGESLVRADYFAAFLKGVAKRSDAQLGNLGLQVIATHSGGLALEGNSDVDGEIQRCLTDVQSWYEITFDPLPADKPDEYHHIEIKLDQHNLVARTLDGYYANPHTIDTGH